MRARVVRKVALNATSERVPPSLCLPCASLAKFLTLGCVNTLMFIDILNVCKTDNTLFEIVR